MPVFMFLLMMGMGSTLSPGSFRQLLKQPAPALIGLASQYGWMPLIAWGLALTLNLSPPIALGLIIMGCVSGGPISNFFTYIARGDLSLSVSMTVISTLSGFLMIPLMLSIYAASLFAAVGDGNLAIPHGKIITTLLIITVPVVLGMILRSRSRIWARRMERGGMVAGLAIIAVIVAGVLFRHSDTLMQINASAGHYPDQLPTGSSAGINDCAASLRCHHSAADSAYGLVDPAHPGKWVRQRRLPGIS